MLDAVPATTRHVGQWLYFDDQQIRIASVGATWTTPAFAHEHDEKAATT